MVNVYRVSVLPEDKKSWGLVAQNVNVLNMEMGEVVDPHVLCLPSVCGKSLSKE